MQVTFLNRSANLKENSVSAKAFSSDGHNPNDESNKTLTVFQLILNLTDFLI